MVTPDRTSTAPARIGARALPPRSRSSSSRRRGTGATGRFHACSALSRSLARRVTRRRAERPRDASGGPCATRARADAHPRRRRVPRRFERFFTELHDPLYALYGDDPRFPAAWDALLDASPPPPPRATRSCARSTTSARSPPTGCTASRRSATSPTSTASPGRCRASASGSPTCASSASPTCTSCRCCARARSPTTAATPSPTTARSSRRWARWTTCASWPPTCARRAWRCASTSCSTTPRASTRGRARRWRATRAASPSTARSPTGPSPTPTSARCPRCSPTPRPAASRAVPELGRWVWTTFNDVPVGPRLRQPRGVRRDGRGDARRSPPRASTCCGSTPCRSCGSGWAPTARTSPRCTSCCRRSARVVRIAAPAVAFKAEAIVAPRDLVAYLGVGRHDGHGVRPRLPQRAHGPAVERARLAAGRAARRATLASMPPVPAGRRVGHLRPLPRRHRLGDHRRGRGRGGRGRPRCTARFLTDFYAGDFPGSFARGARFQPDPHRRGAHSAARRRRWPGSSSRWTRRRARGRAWRSAGCSCSTPSRSPSAGSR